MDRVWIKNYPPGRASNCPEIPYDSLGELFDSVCKKGGKKTALHCLGSDTSYEELQVYSDAFASFLQNELGLKKGDRLAIVLPNIVQFPVVFLAAQKIGVICVPTNPQYTPAEMLHQFKDSGAIAIVILDLFLDKLEKIIAKTQIRSIVATGVGDQFHFLKSTIFSLALKFKGQIPKTTLRFHHYREALRLGSISKPNRPKLTRDDIAVLQYTGGTTGVSKGAILTHGSILANIFQIQEWINPNLNAGKETVLAALPMFHIFGLTANCLAFLSRGDRIILVPKPIPIENTAVQFSKFDISIVLGVNTLFNALNHSSTFRKIAPKSVKFAMAGGMALQASVAKEWFEITGNRVHQGFGLTEASPVTHIVPLDGEWPLGSIGLPVPGTDSQLVDEDGNPVAPGQRGELLIKGPQVMKGYWNRLEETQNSLRDGWLRTGDIAEMDDNGYFFIVDRKKDMILVAGFNVYPNEVEEVIASHPKVLEVAVIGVAHRTAGETIKAFVVKKDPALSESEIKIHCKELLAHYKVPRSIEFRDSLPKTLVGKILRKDLRQPPPSPLTH